MGRAVAVGFSAVVGVYALQLGGSGVVQPCGVLLGREVDREDEWQVFGARCTLLYQVLGASRCEQEE